MPSPFDITTVSNTVALDNNRTGIAAFTVKNNTRRRIHATARLTTDPPEGEKWLSIESPDGNLANANDRDFPIDATQSYQVKVAVPMDATPGAYTMTLTVADDNNPDDNFSVSPGLIFTVKEIPKPAPRPFPVWIIPAIIIVVVVIVVIIVVGVVVTNNEHTHQTETAVAAAQQTQTTVALQTQAAQQTQTAIALQTQAVQQQQTAIAAATQTALNVFVGDWTPINGADTTALGQLTIKDIGANQVNLTFTSSCLPGSLACFAIPQVYSVSNVAFNPNQLATSVGSLSIIIQPAGVNQLFVTLISNSGSIFGNGTAQINVVRSSVRAPLIKADIAATAAPLTQLQIDEMLKAAAAESAATEAATEASTEAVTETPTPG